jgi:hypothetical protein
VTPAPTDTRTPAHRPTLGGAPGRKHVRTYHPFRLTSPARQPRSSAPLPARLGLVQQKNTFSKELFCARMESGGNPGTETGPGDRLAASAAQVDRRDRPLRPLSAALIAKGETC